MSLASDLLNLRVHLPGPLTAALRSAKSTGSTFLARRERSLLTDEIKNSWPPIFIIGLPRSGSTLLYQVLTSGLSLSYFCNLANDFYLSPVMVTKLLSRFGVIVPPRKYESWYGDTDGWNAPSSGRAIWKRWFPSDQSYVGMNELPPISLRSMRSTIGMIETSIQYAFY